MAAPWWEPEMSLGDFDGLLSRPGFLTHRTMDDFQPLAVDFLSSFIFSVEENKSPDGLPLLNEGVISTFLHWASFETRGIFFPYQTLGQELETWTPLWSEFGAPTVAGSHSLLIRKKIYYWVLATFSRKQIGFFLFFTWSHRGEDTLCRWHSIKSGCHARVRK